MVHLRYDASTQAVQTFHRECWIASETTSRDAARDESPSEWVSRG